MRKILSVLVVLLLTILVPCCWGYDSKSEKSSYFSCNFEKRLSINLPSLIADFSRQMENETSRLLYDYQNGKPVLKSLSGVYEDEAEFERLGKQILEAVYSEWENKAELELSAELEVLDEENSRDFLNSFAQYKAKIKEEFQSLLEQSQANFLNLRLKGTCSEENKTARQTAQLNTAELLDEIYNETGFFQMK